MTFVMTEMDAHKMQEVDINQITEILPLYSLLWITHDKTSLLP